MSQYIILNTEYFNPGIMLMNMMQLPDDILPKISKLHQQLYPITEYQNTEYHNSIMPYIDYTFLKKFFIDLSLHTDKSMIELPRSLIYYNHEKDIWLSEEDAAKETVVFYYLALNFLLPNLKKELTEILANPIFIKNPAKKQLDYTPIFEILYQDLLKFKGTV